MTPKVPHQEDPSVRPYLDYDRASRLLGPNTRIMQIESGPEGGIFYQFEKKSPRFLNLSQNLRLNHFLMIDMPKLTVFLHPETGHLRAISAWLGSGGRVLLFGENWGTWVDANGEKYSNSNIPGLIRQWRAPVMINETQSLITMEFRVNPYDPSNFTNLAAQAFRNGKNRHVVNLMYRYPSGHFVTSRIVVHERKTNHLLFISDVDKFPLTLPPSTYIGSSKVTVEAKSTIKSKSSGRHPHLDIQDTTIPKPPPETSRPRQGKHPYQSGNARTDCSPVADNPPPLTTHLPTHELLSVLTTEKTPDRQWLIIEPNLIQGKPERTYPLIINYPEIIEERTQDWPPNRLALAFSHQPGSILIELMSRWMNHQVLAVADGNPEEIVILDWLREREIGRLMLLELSDVPATPNEAAMILNVAREAESQIVRKTWRLLLSFINADVGRSEERPIHRKKDEIAKHLQIAKNIMMKN